MVKILLGDCAKRLKEIADNSVDCCVTSPPYFGLRDYGHSEQIGSEGAPDLFVQKLVEVFREVKRTLKEGGTLWLNLGDSYAGSGGAGNQFGQLERGLSKYKQKNKPSDYGLKPKDLIGIPWRVAFALQADGWYLRQDIIWHKPNPMPESVTDRCTKAHEYIFLFSKSSKYYYDKDSIGEKTRNRQSVWTITTKPFFGAHFATFPPDLIEPCILAGCPEGGTVIDPFGGAGTTGLVSQRLGRNAILCELNPSYAQLAHQRIKDDMPIFTEIELVGESANG